MTFVGDFGCDQVKYARITITHICFVAFTFAMPGPWEYSKNCVKQPLKIDKAKILMTNGSLMKVESIAE